MKVKKFTKLLFSLLFFTTIVKNNNIFLGPSFVLSCCAILENKIIGETFSSFYFLVCCLPYLLCCQ